MKFRKIIIILNGLAQIPAHSRLALAIQKVLTFARENGSDWEKTVERIWQEFGHYHPVHTINNAAIVAAALVHSELDFTKAISIAIAAGWDTDCNGATVGSIWGVVLGANQLPAHWIIPLNNRLLSSIRDFESNLITELAERTYQLAR